VNISTIARIFDIKPKTLYHWYRNYLSDFKFDKEHKIWPSKYLEKVDMDTGEVVQDKPLYVFKPENIGERMSIDDKAIGHDGSTILSNNQTGKIALLLESCKSDEVAAALSLFGEYLQTIQSISCDMDASYLKVCFEQLPDAKVVIDKFHVIRYAYEAVLEVRTNLKNELSSQLSKGKQKTETDKEILYKLGLLKRCRHRLTQSPDKWTEAATEIMKQVFINHNQLRVAYELAQNFKKWYVFNNNNKSVKQIYNELYQWYHQVKEAKFEEFNSVVKMIRKHEDEIINYFQCGQTSAKAERINGQINRFISNNYGIKDKEFILYRIAGYFS
jgi:transposase